MQMQQQPKNGNKKQEQAEMSTSHHRPSQQNTHIEHPLSLHDDGSLDDISDEEGRYIVEFCCTIFTLLENNDNGNYNLYLCFLCSGCQLMEGRNTR